MKQYRDIFGNPLPKKHVEIATRFILRSKRVNTFATTRQLNWGVGKVSRIVELLEDAGVVSRLTAEGQERTILLKNEDSAVNAALRQLRKGKVTRNE